MPHLRRALSPVLLVLPLAACFDVASLEGGENDAGGSSSDGSTLSDAAPGGDASSSSDSSTPSNDVVHLTTKNIYGAPNGAFKIVFEGSAPANNLSLVFRDSANLSKYSSKVSAAGDIQLPPAAGTYEVALRDDTTGLASYGQATVTKAVTSFAASQLVTLPTFTPFASWWPQSSMQVGDLNGDGHADLMIPSGQDTGVATAPGIYPYLWTPASGNLQASTPIPLTGKLVCAAVLLDADLDGDADIVFTSNEPASYEYDLCVMSNNGSGGFAAPSCSSQVGTNTSMFECNGGIATGDFDRDGRVDIAVAGGRYNTQGAAGISKDVVVYRNTATGFTAETTLTTASNIAFYSVAVGDIDDDGKLDILTNGGSPSAVHFFTATGDFTFGSATQTAGDQTDPLGGFYADQITLAYLNSDTNLDVLLSHTNGPSSVLYSGSTGYSLSTVPDFTEQHAGRFHALDLNIDGVPDIIVPYKNRLLANNTLGALWANANNITGAATPSTSNSIFGSATTSSWVEGSMLFADFNNDGKIDAAHFATYIMELEVLNGN